MTASRKTSRGGRPEETGPRMHYSTSASYYARHENRFTRRWRDSRLPRRENLFDSLQTVASPRINRETSRVSSRVVGRSRRFLASLGQRRAVRVVTLVSEVERLSLATSRSGNGGKVARCTFRLPMPRWTLIDLQFLSRYIRHNAERSGSANSDHRFTGFLSSFNTGTTVSLGMTGSE